MMEVSDEQIKRLQEFISVVNEQRNQEKLSSEIFKPVAEKCARLAEILDGFDTERVRLSVMEYHALEEKRFRYVHNMLDVINQSKEDSEKILLKVRQGGRGTGCHHGCESQGTQ